MALSTFTDLVSAVQDFLHRSDVTTAQVGTFVTLAESDFNRNLRTTGQISTATLTATSVSTALPTDWLDTKSVTLTIGGVNHVLEPMDEQTIRAFTVASIPAFFCVSGTNLLLGPAPSATCSVSLTYYAKIPNLQTNSTNHLMTLYPDLYLWRTLFEAAKWARDSELVQIAMGEYQRCLNETRYMDRNRQIVPGAAVVRK